MADKLKAFLPEELTGGFFQDILFKQVGDYLRGQWETIKKAIADGDLSGLDSIIGKIADVVAGALGGRISAAAIKAWILATSHLWEEWVNSGKIRVGATDGKPLVIHDDIGAYVEDCEALLFPTAASIAPEGEPNPKFGFMGAIAIAGLIINLVRLWRDEKKKKNA